MHSTENIPATERILEGENKPAQKCAYCGNNPVPHFINWYFESLNVLLTPVRQLLIKNPVSRALRHAGRGWNLGWQVVRFFKLVRVLSEQPDREKCKVTRASVLWEEAEKRGVVMKELLLFGKPFDTYIAYKKISNNKFQTRTIVFSGLPRPFNDEPAILDVMDDKAILKKLFQKHNLPVPKGGAAVTLWAARKIFRSIEKPVIVKPRVGSRGRHSTTFIYDEGDLKTAFRAAKQLCFWAMVEEQLEGPVYRATCINFKICGVLRGDSPHVTGDGVHTLEELVATKNSQPHPGVKDITVDEKMKVYVGRQISKKNLQLRQGYVQSFANRGLGYVGQEFPKDALEFIPQAGETISLTEKIGVNYGGSSSEDLSICHPDNKELFERASKVLGDPVVGFDFIIPDITKSWKEQRCGFIEANSLPFINLHHDPLLGKPENVAAKVWEMVENEER